MSRRSSRIRAKLTDATEAELAGEEGGRTTEERKEDEDVIVQRMSSRAKEGRNASGVESPEEELRWLRRGARCEGRWHEDLRWYSGEIRKVYPDRSADILFHDGEFQRRTPLDHIRAERSPSAAGSGEEEEEGEDVEENGKEGRVHRSRSNVSLASSSGLGARKRRGGQDIESEEEDGKEAEEVHEYVHSDAEGEDASGKELWRSGRRKTWLYAHIKERAAWKASLEGSTRLAAAAYNTGVLLEAAHGMTEALAGVKRKAEREAQAANKRQR